MHAQDHAIVEAGARLVMPSGTEDAAICFVDRATATPLAWRPYRLQIGPHLVLGRTDAEGCTAVLTGAQRAGLAGWALE
jgi:hypothetical protein